MKRIAVGRLFHESHGYAPATAAADITVVRGEAVIEGAKRNGTTLGGIVDALIERADIEILPVSDSMIAPSGAIDHGFYVEQRQFWGEELKKLAPDAIVLDLHGSMSTTEVEDAEGDFLFYIRGAIGGNAVIGVGLDLHANITPQMLRAADICIACKNNPHDDYYDNGKKVVRLVFDVLEGRLRPVYTFAKTRMIAPGRLETHLSPLKEMHARARALEKSGAPVVDLSIYNAYRFADLTDMGQAAVILSNGPYAQAKAIVEDYAQEFWELRESFKDETVTIAEALHATAKDKSGITKALADLGDRTLAGAPGDSTLILQAALKHPVKLQGAMTVNDPKTVAQAHAAGVGAKIRMRLGGKMTPLYLPFEVEGMVKMLNNKDIKLIGPSFANESAAMGKTALVEIDNRFLVIVTSKPGFIVDRAIFESHGVNIREQDFVVIKSQFHFNRNFEGVAATIYVASAGLSYFVPGAFPKKRARVWPDTNVDDAAIVTAQVVERLTTV
ncbi:M81 family metallopeptidase [Mesorhizobium sp. M0222]|uniref:M81 family metallopeptidase n=1 Tax=Mesorhizobium sp. M0222 TaxID=2956921 RepID=UPI0033384102